MKRMNAAPITPVRSPNRGLPCGNRKRESKKREDEPVSEQRGERLHTGSSSANRRQRERLGAEGEKTGFGHD